MLVAFHAKGQTESAGNAVQPVQLEQVHVEPKQDSLIMRIAAEPDPIRQYRMLAILFEKVPEASALGIELTKRLNGAAIRADNLVLEALSNSILGTRYRWMGNPVRALQCHQKAIELAQKSENTFALTVAYRQTGHIYKDREDYASALKYYRLSLAPALKSSLGDTLVGGTYMNLGQAFLGMGQLDSSLLYAQGAYAIAIKMPKEDDIIHIYINLGSVQSRMGNQALALPYLKMALSRSQAIEKKREICLSLTALAEHFIRFKEPDSAAHYARLAVEAPRGTAGFYVAAKPAHLLADIYYGRKCDSSLKYARMAEVAADSLNSKQAGQQIQLMTIEESARQADQAREAEQTQRTREQNIQYALLALCIVVLISLYLVLSRSFITNIKVIEYTGILSLLIVFEFLNLFLHPLLEEITHHNPALMLIALVALASLLVPLHHRIEKWAIATLVAKNRSIRLNHAKKTIAELEP